jgi:hypothetical protein
MFFQSVKESCKGEYVYPDLTNSTCLDDIGLIAEVRSGLATSGFCNTNFSHSFFFFFSFFFAFNFMFCYLLCDSICSAQKM